MVGGTATFANVGKTLSVTNSPNAIINWQGFSIGAGEATRFIQQSAASSVLNRVVGQDPSAILGTLSSNGRVFLINPNGILFGVGSRVDVAGLVASTLNISNQDFLAGRLNFQSGAVANPIQNYGSITTPAGGQVYLIAPNVENHGVISTPQGQTILAAGKSAQLVEADVPNLRVEVTAGGEALNVGQILAEGGSAGIYAGLINQKGIVRADSVSRDATGRIVFRASGRTMLEAGSVTSASGEQGGRIEVTGSEVGLTGNARVEATGREGGGTILIGGDYQGKNPEVPNARATYVGSDVTIDASAIESGDGGKVIVWADEATRVYGTISARGGSGSGNGGFVETSSKGYLGVTRAPDVSAPAGNGGTWLLDPLDITVTGATLNIADVDGGPGANYQPTASPSTISAATIEGVLNGGNSVILDTNVAGGEAGNITVNSAISKTAGGNASLTLNANNDININASITSTVGQLNLVLNPDSDSNASGAINLGTATLDANGGTISAAGKTVNIASGTVTINSTFNAGNLFLSSGTLTGAGDLTVNGVMNWSGGTMTGAGQTVVASGANLNVTAPVSLSRLITNQSGGTIALSGTGQVNTNSDGTVLENLAGGLLDIQNNGGFAGDNGFLETVLNAGTFTKSAGALTSTVSNIAFSNTGTVQAQAGTLSFPSGTLTSTGIFDAQNPGTTISFGGGSKTFNGGTQFIGAGVNLFNASGSLSGAVTANNFEFAGGTLSGTATISKTAGTGMKWTAGTFSGGGTLTLDSSALLSIEGAGTKTLSNYTLANQGTINVLSTNSVSTNGDGTVLSNQVGGLVNVQTDVGFAGDNGFFETVLNAGTFRTSAGALSSTISNIAFNNTGGTLDILSGQLNLAGTFNHSGAGSVSAGTINNSGGGSSSGSLVLAAGTQVNITGGTQSLATGTSLTGAGAYRVAGGTLSVSGAVSAVNVEVASGTLSGAGNLTISNVMNWSGGSQNTVGGATTIASGAVLNITGATAKGLQRTIVNQSGGTVALSGTGTISTNSDGTVVDNQAGANFNITADQSFSGDNGALEIFNNSGTITKSVTAGSTSFGNVQFNNTAPGVVNVNSGTVSIGSGGSSTGSFVMASGARTDFTGSYTLNGGSLTGAGQARLVGSPTLAIGGPVSVDNLDQPGGTLTGAGDLTVNGMYSWSGGSQTGAGKTVIAGGGVLEVTGAGSLSRRVEVQSGGTMRLTGAGQVNTNSDGTVLENLAGGLLDIQNNGGFAGDNGSLETVLNAGTFRKSAGALTSAVNNIAFTNAGTGTVQAQAGTLQISNFAGGVNSGILDVAAGATLSTGGAALSNDATGLIRGNGTIDLGAATLTNDGTIAPGAAAGDTTGTLSITGNYSQGAGGALNVELGGTAAGSYDVLAVSGTATLAGALNRSYVDSYTPVNGDTLKVLTYVSRSGAFTSGTDPNSLALVYGTTGLDLLKTAGTANTWVLAGGGDWNTPANWSLTHVPLSTEDAIVGDLSGAQTITLASNAGTAGSFSFLGNETFQINASGSLTVSGASSIGTGGTLHVNGGTLTMNGALSTPNLTLSLSGTIANATLSAATLTGIGGSLGGGGGPLLDGVTLGSNLTTSGFFRIGNSLTLANGVVVNKGNGNWGFNTTGAQSIAVQGGTGSATINNAGGIIRAGHGIAGQTLEIGAGVTLQGYGSLDQFNTGGIVNAGSIISNTTGQTFTINPGSFTNNGTLGVTDGTLTLSASNWSNAGSFNISGGILNLGGTFIPTGWGPTTRTGGVVNVTGALTNTGNTLDIGGAGIFGAGGLGALMSGGSIVNGTITSGDGTALTGSGGSLGGGGGPLLDGVTLGSNLTIDGFFNISNSLALANGVVVNKGNGNWGFNTTGAQSIAVQGGTGSATINNAGGIIRAGHGIAGQTLEIGAGVTLQGYGSLDQFNTGGIVNAGSIISNTTGQTFTINPGSFTNNGTLGVTDGTLTLSASNWSNAGSFNISGGILNLGGTFIPTGWGPTTRTGGVVNVTGTLTNTGNTLDIGGAGIFGAGGLGAVVSGGGIVNGTIVSGDSTALTGSGGSLGGGGGPLLDGVTLGSNLTASGFFRIGNSLTLANGITVNRSGDWGFITTGAQSIAMQGGTGSATINTAGGIIRAGHGIAGQTLEIGAGVTLQGYGSLDSSNAVPVTNNGSIISNTAGQTFTINPATFTNNGTLSVTAGTMTTGAGFTSNAGTIVVGTGSILTTTNTSLANSGTIQGAGTLDLGTGTLTNDGAMRPGGAGAVGTLSITGNYSQGPAGSLDVDLASGASYDVLAVSGSATLNGTLNVNYLGGYIASGSPHAVMSYASQSGTFSTINDAQAQTATYGGTSFVLAVAGGPVSWDGEAGDGQWSSALNWSNNAVPTGTTDVQIPELAGVQIITVPSGSQAAQSVVLIGDETLSLAGGSLTVANSSSAANGTLFISGGTLAGAGPWTVKNLNLSSGGISTSGNVTVNTALAWSGGSIGGSGTLTTGSGATSTLSGTTKTLTGRTWNNFGTVDWVGGNITLSDVAATINNKSGATWNILTAGPGDDLNGAGTFNNNAGATINANAPAGSNSIHPSVVNHAGTVNLLQGDLDYDGNVTANFTGTLNFSNGTRIKPYSFTGTPTLNFGSGASVNVVSGAAEIRMDSGSPLNINSALTLPANMTLTQSAGTVTANAPLTMAAGSTYNLSGGILTGAANVTLNGTFNWTGDFLDIAGAGTLTTNGVSTLLNTGGSALRLMGGRHWVNNGSASLTGGHMSINGGSTFTNAAGGSFTVTTADPIGIDSDGSGTNTFNNIGTLNWNTGAVNGISVVSAFNNTGTVNVDGGTMNVAVGGTHTGMFDVAPGATLNFAGGTHSFNAGSSFAGTGTVGVTGATANFNSAASVNTLGFSSGSVAGSGSLTVQDWSRSGGSFSMTGSADLRVPGGNFVVAQPYTAGALTLRAPAGGISQSAPLIVSGSSIFLAGAAPINLTNAGNDFTGPVSLSNSGANSVAITDANSISFTPLTLGGSFTVTAPSIILGNVTTSGSQQYNGATSLSGSYLTSGGSFTVSGATTLAGATTVTVGAGNANFNTVDGPYSLAVNSSGTETFGTVGGTTPLASITTDAPGAVVLNGNVTTTGAQSFHDAVIAGGVTLTSTGGGAITAMNPANDFTGTVNLTGGATHITDANALTLGTLATGSLTVTSSGALNLGQGTINGGLVATSNNGNIGQSGALTVTDTTDLIAGTGMIALNSPNDFQGLVSAGGTGGISLTDVNALLTDTINAGAGFVTLSAGSISGSNTVTGGSASLSSDTNVTGLDVNISGNFGVLGAATLWDLTGAIGGAVTVPSPATTVILNGTTLVAETPPHPTPTPVATICGGLLDSGTGVCVPLPPIPPPPPVVLAPTAPPPPAPPLFDDEETSGRSATGKRRVPRCD